MGMAVRSFDYWYRDRNAVKSGHPLVSKQMFKSRGDTYGIWIRKSLHDQTGEARQ